MSGGEIVLILVVITLLIVVIWGEIKRGGFSSSSGKKYTVYEYIEHLEERNGELVRENITLRRKIRG